MDIFILHDYMLAECMSYFRLSSEIGPKRVFHCLTDDYEQNLKIIKFAPRVQLISTTQELQGP